ncbi:hypothetical protein [Streptomyces sp. CA-106131]|uniref:hypothetical protein n=1 Tax=Streptomyces sp. CA-106131 TaxID=3240045 RepID=UPI003D90410C
MVTEWSRSSAAGVFGARGTRAEARSAASRPTPPSRCEYVSAVMLIEEWPSRFDTIATSTPAASMSDA